MKKTLIVTLEFPPTVGGIATYVHDMANAMDPSKTIVLTPEHKEQKQFDGRQRYKILRKKLFSPKFIWPRWWKLVRHVKKIVKQEEIELIMVHHVLPAGYAAILRKKFGKIPFLLFSHGTDLVAGTATKWKKRMVTMVSQHADQIVFNSESLKRRFLRVLPQFEEKSLVLYPCPNPSFLQSPDPKELDALKARYALKGKNVILSVSRLAEGKGFPHLLRMMPEVLEKAPHTVWMIVGDGPKKDDLIKQIQEMNLQNVIRFIGETPHKDIKKYYYLADLFVLLTHPDEGREEGLGLVFLEAAAAGLPVVAGRSGGVEEAVKDKETGLVVDLRAQAKDIPAMISELLNNPEELAEVGERAKDRIRSDFVWEYQLNKLKPWLQDE
ncbi:MAG: glycosyltransferase family 4 protein [Candidatus Magasanikbacteria bacterium]